MNIDFKKWYPHLISLTVFLAVTLAYFSPLLDGKELYQSDITHFKGMSKEIIDYRESTGEEALWTNSMFGGMPAYQISVQYKNNLIQYIDKLFIGWLPRPANYVFLYMVGFYILLLCMKVDPWLSLMGAIAFAFSSYFFIILEAGHNSKAHAIGYMAPVLGGLILAYRRNRLLGASVMALFLALMLKANHVQITYYLGFVLLSYVIYEAYLAIKEKAIPTFTKTSLVLAAAAILAVSTNISNLWATWEYGKYTTRGKSELTFNKENQTDGLDRDYVTGWSYGIGETFTFLIPNFKGGASEGFDPNSSEVSNLSPKYLSVVPYAQKYFGDQPFTSGPVYIGAIIVFLFVLSLLFLSKGLVWALVVPLLITTMLSWGNNFMGFTDFFLDYFPGYNKFRAVSMILVIAELIIPFMAILVLNELLNRREEMAKQMKKVYYAFGITGGICLLVAIMPSMFTDFSNDGADSMLGSQLKQANFPSSEINGFFAEVEELRRSIMVSDAWRSFAFILLAFGLVYFYLKGKMKGQNMVIALTVLVLFDLWSVDKRYINESSFVEKNQMQNPFPISAADEQILSDTDPNFRVFNTTKRLDQDSKTSYYHKSLGGYHGAKLKRYQELIDFHMYKGNMAVLNMLNTKYFIVQTKEGQEMAQVNPDALGNAWFVSNYKLVENADSEITALTSFDPSKTCVVDKRYAAMVEGFSADTSFAGNIKLDEYKPNYLKYSSNAEKDGLAVFSEIYYDKGWDAYIDGTPAEYFRANYVLRAMKIPSGSHTIEFKFEPKVYTAGQTVALVSSSLLILAFLGVAFQSLKNKPEQQ